MTRKPRCAADVHFEKEAEFVGATVAQRWRRRLAIGGGLLLLGVGGGAWWLWGQARAVKRERAERVIAVAAAEAQLAAAQVALRDANLAPEEQIRRLEMLASSQRELATLRPERFAAQVEDVRRTEQRVTEARAQLARQYSEDAEAAAHERLAAGDAVNAAERLREALKLQREVNAGAADGTRNFDRELRLQRELAELTAEPWEQAVATKTEEARAALAGARWDEALGLFREARELQERLNREFPRTRYSDLTAIARLDAEIAALTADGLDTQVNDRVQRARQLAAGARTDEAVKELMAAAAMQRQINERFGKSRFVSMERLEEIEAERQTLLAENPLRTARAKLEETRGFLRKRQIFQAQQRVREGLAVMEDLRTRFPKARQRDEEFRLAFVFLDLRAGDIAALQDRFFDQLSPLGEGPRAMLRTEVSQADFAKVLSLNPSRNPGRALPVDSVIYAEAEEFCRRLSWVLGWRVRLPTEEEMRTASAAGAGFQDVDGGLAEWIASAVGRENPTASVWSGSGEIVNAPRTERARTRGFRVVVEVDLARLDAVE